MSSVQKVTYTQFKYVLSNVLSIFQTNAQIRGAEKRNFLRKGEGTSRISKGKDCSQKLQRRHSVSPQMKLSQQTICPTEFHQKEMPNRSSAALKGIGNFCDQRSGMEDPLKKTFALQDDDLSSNNKGKVKALTANNNADSLNSKHSVGVLRKFDKTNGSKPSGSALAQSKESVGFKNINDHIVKIPEKGGLTTNYRLHSQNGCPSREVNLTDEVMESLALSDSHNSTSSEDGPNSQSHWPLPHYLSRHMDHKDQSLDSSDGDYASDAPSETRFNEEHHTFSMSSSSSFSSDSELKSLEGSLADCSKTTEERGINSDFRQPSASELLTMEFPKVKVTPEDTTHGMGQEQPHTPIRFYRKITILHNNIFIITIALKLKFLFLNLHIHEFD